MAKCLSVTAKKGVVNRLKSFENATAIQFVVRIVVSRVVRLFRTYNRILRRLSLSITIPVSADSPNGMSVEKYARIERNDVREGHDDWTEGKEQAAQIIQSKIDSGEWPMPLNELADECDWSRSHLQNTLRDLFRRVDEPENHTEHTIDVPDDIQNMSDYLRGYANGINHARQE